MRQIVTGDLSEGAVSTFYNSSRPLQVIFIFLFVRKIFENKKLPFVVEKAVLSMGKCTFGIYLIEQILREKYYVVYDKLCTKINVFGAVMIYVFIVVISGWIIIAICKLIDALIIRLFHLVFKKKNAREI